MCVAVCCRDTMYSHTRPYLFNHGTWLIHTRDMTHSYTRHDSFIHGTWHIHTRDMTHSYTEHDSFTHGTWLIHTQDMTHSSTGHDSFMTNQALSLATRSSSPSENMFFWSLSAIFKHNSLIKTNQRSALSHLYTVMSENMFFWSLSAIFKPNPLHKNMSKVSSIAIVNSKFGEHVLLVTQRYLHTQLPSKEKSQTSALL